MTDHELTGAIGEIDSEIQSLTSKLDAERAAIRARILELTSRRDALATARKALRAGLTDYAAQVLGPLGIASTGGVGTPGQ
jgi:hypothetical protein